MRGRDNLPILSWLLLRGRCRDCKAPISIRYPLVELTCACLFVTAFVMRVGPGPAPAAPMSWHLLGLLTFDFYLIACVLVTSLIDIDLHIIPDEISFTGVPIALVAAFLAPSDALLASAPFLEGSAWQGPVAAGLGALAGGGGLWLLGYVGTRLLGESAMGGGDVKIMAVFGGFIGWDACAGAFMVAVMVGGVLRRSQLRMGRLSRPRTGDPQLGQIELRGVEMPLQRRGRRQTHTFRNEPHAAPKA